jgi:hypothetical protein
MDGSERSHRREEKVAVDHEEAHPDRETEASAELLASIIGVVFGTRNPLIDQSIGVFPRGRNLQVSFLKC